MLLLSRKRFVDKKKMASLTPATLLDLHNRKAVFNFCGGMLFQLRLTPALCKRLQQSTMVTLPVAEPPCKEMSRLPGYKASSFADDVSFFHGREVRDVPKAAGGMNLVLELSSASEEDKQGWTAGERADYDGWRHDSGRPWRTAEKFEAGGCENFKERYGPKAYGLHHRFFFRTDKEGALWLSAEDGCEGYLFGM